MNEATRRHYAADPRWHALRAYLQDNRALWNGAADDAPTAGDFACSLLLAIDDATGQDVQDIVFGRHEEKV